MGNNLYVYCSVFVFKCYFIVRKISLAVRLFLNTSVIRTLSNQ
jgi:hypothetical protein